MRNIEKRKKAEREAETLREQVRRLSLELMIAKNRMAGMSPEGFRELQMAADALMIAVAQRYGVAIVEESEDGETGEVSYRLRIPEYNVEELIKHWEAHATRCEGGYQIDVQAKESKEQSNASEGDHDHGRAPCELHSGCGCVLC